MTAPERMMNRMQKRPCRPLQQSPAWSRRGHACKEPEEDSTTNQGEERRNPVPEADERDKREGDNERDEGSINTVRFNRREKDFERETVSSRYNRVMMK